MKVTVCLPVLGGMRGPVVFARLIVGTHQTCIALNTDSINGEIFNNGLKITFGFRLDLGGSVEKRLCGPVPASLVVVSNKFDTWGKGQNHDAWKRWRPRRSGFEVSSDRTR